MQINADHLDRLFNAIRDCANVANNMPLAHLATAAINGEQWARERIGHALADLDTTRPDGLVPRGGVSL